MLAFAASLSCRALAGPPFLTDDPEPVDYHHFEFYTFGTVDKNAGGTSTIAPAIEYNIGALPNVQVHIVIPHAFNSTIGLPTTSGIGDTEFGIKYRFVQETTTRPQIGIFPMAEIATGDSTRGLGNGRTWFRLPLWIQKSWGPWTSYGGGGVALNSAPGASNYGFAGWLLQRDLNEHLTLGGELFTQGPQAIGIRGSSYYNVGGYLKPTDRFNILFSLGHTFAGESHAIGYLGLYWTGGPEKKDEKQP